MPMKLRVITAATGLVVVLIVGGVLGGLVAAGRLGGDGGPAERPPASPDVVTVGETLLGPEPLVLTDAELARAQELFANDPRAQALFAGRPYTLKRAGPWSTSSREKIGALMDFEFEQLFVIDGDWPHIQYDETEASVPPYQEFTRNFAVRTDELMVLVDLVRERVVSIQPGIAAEIVRGPTSPPGPTPAPTPF
ncbi:MAG: hypothetical protein V3U79_11920 [Dehalococcoidia bacterium]